MSGYVRTYIWTYLEYILTFYLTYILAFYLAIYLTYILTFHLAGDPAFYLAFFRMKKPTKQQVVLVSTKHRMHKADAYTPGISQRLVDSTFFEGLFF